MNPVEIGGLVILICIIFIFLLITYIIKLLIYGYKSKPSKLDVYVQKYIELRKEEDKRKPKEKTIFTNHPNYPKYHCVIYEKE